VCTASYLRKDGSCLLGVYSFSYMRQVGGRLQRGGVYTVSYIRQIGGCLWGVSELCQLLQEGWRLSSRDV
jgi:hypothetical protein